MNRAQRNAILGGAVLVAVLSHTGAGSAASPGRLAERVPGALLSALGERELAETGECDFLVLEKTQPLTVGIGSLYIHYMGTSLSEADIERITMWEEELETDFTPIPVEVPAETVACRWRRIKKIPPPRGHEFDNVVELSNPLLNPCTDHEDERVGLLARVSLGGGLGADWYWVPFIERADGTWRVVKFVELECHDC